MPGIPIAEVDNAMGLDTQTMLSTWIPSAGLQKLSGFLGSLASSPGQLRSLTQDARLRAHDNAQA